MRDDALDVLLVRPEHAREKRSKHARHRLRVFTSRALDLPEQPDAKERERTGRNRLEIFLNFGIGFHSNDARAGLDDEDLLVRAPGAEIGLDHRLRAINEHLGLRGSEALPFRESSSVAPVVK